MRRRRRELNRRRPPGLLKRRLESRRRPLRLDPVAGRDACRCRLRSAAKTGAGARGPAGPRACGAADDRAASGARRIAGGRVDLAAAADSRDSGRPRRRSRRHARASRAPPGYAVAPCRHSRRPRRRQERAVEPFGRRGGAVGRAVSRARRRQRSGAPGATLALAPDGILRRRRSQGESLFRARGCRGLDARRRRRQAAEPQCRCRISRRSGSAPTPKVSGNARRRSKWRSPRSNPTSPAAAPPR